MAEIDYGDYEVKDEELVDFEDSDYGFGSDVELEVDYEVDQPKTAEVDSSTRAKIGESDEKQTEAAHLDTGNEAAESLGEAVTLNTAVEKERKEEVKRGKIEEKDEKEDGVVVQQLSSFAVVTSGYSLEGKVEEARRKHRKADLEDGELDDAAMPEGSNREAEADPDDEKEYGNDRLEKKRRKDRFAAERQSENYQGKERESTSLTSGPGFMQNGMFSRAASMAPGIMGPGRPLLPLDLSPLQQMGRGFVGPVNSVQMMHLQEAVAVQEQMLRSHQMMQQLAHVHAGGRGRHPMAGGPVGCPLPSPMLGIEFGGRLPQGLMHLQSASPDLFGQMNFVGPGDAYSRSLRAESVDRVMAGRLGQEGTRMISSPRSVIGRQNQWAANGDVVPTEGARGKGRGQVPPPIWGDRHGVMPPAVVAQANGGQSLGVGQSVNIGQARSAHVMGAGQAKARQGAVSMGHGNHNPQRAPERAKAPGRVERDGTWKASRDRATRSDAAKTKENDLRTSSAVASGNKRERAGGHENDSESISIPSRSVLTPQYQGVSNGSASTSNLIQLGGPVQKSRVLTVSGLPVNTSMSLVVEAFEKLGKIMDFKKEERGDAFTITFATISEAISAQRHLHRSILGGRQITVEYAVQQPDS
ncbi:hypothetical protein R1sor_009943 [Riccia sorocarpa]|uniref:RRM domain-containing protein n=1 Tax=Riccia sorocarpa TaxID=122646 RepID=A0ABD3HWJ4_9MARC